MNQGEQEKCNTDFDLRLGGYNVIAFPSRINVIAFLEPGNGSFKKAIANEDLLIFPAVGYNLSLLLNSDNYWMLQSTSLDAREEPPQQTYAPNLAPREVFRVYFPIKLRFKKSTQ